MDILNLIRRSSNIDYSDSSSIPQHALVGLSDTEKEHVKKVIENARKSSQSPAGSRRYVTMGGGGIHGRVSVIRMGVDQINEIN